MWTVGRSNFGENDKHPAVMEALERMVELIVNARDLAEQARASRDSASQVCLQYDDLHNVTLCDLWLMLCCGI